MGMTTKKLVVSPYHATRLYMLSSLAVLLKPMPNSSLDHSKSCKPSTITIEQCSLFITKKHPLRPLVCSGNFQRFSCYHKRKCRREGHFCHCFYNFIKIKKNAVVLRQWLVLCHSVDYIHSFHVSCHHLMYHLFILIVICMNESE